MKRISTLFLILCSALFTHAQQWGDYTLYSVQNSTAAALLDTNGTTYHTWSFASNKKTGYSSYLLPGGDLIRTISNQGNSLNGGGMTGAIQKVDWNGNVLWDYVYSSSTYCLHHDICPLPNGNVLLVSYDVHTASEMTAAGSSISHTMWLEKIMEVQQNGATGGDIVWEWKAIDHLCQDADPTKGNYVSNVFEHPELLDINYGNSQQSSDWLHLNGIDYNPALDQIVFSSHYFDELYIIDHSTTTAEAASHSGGNSGKGGDILYRWGNPAAYSGTGSSTLNVVHDAHWIPQGCPNAGYIVGFNNNGVSQQTSCIDMVNPPMIGSAYDVTPGTAILPTSYTIRQNCNGHTNNMGNSQQLPNGNMLICIAQSGTIYEIDPNGNTIWTKTVNGTVPQAFRYDACYVSGGVPATPVLSGDATLLTATGGTNYAWYLNGNLINGASGASWNPAQTGTGMYQVVALGNGNCNSSLSNAIDVIISSIDEQPLSEINVYPNPANDYVRFSIPSSPTGYYSYTLRNSLGQIVQSGNTTGSIPTADLSDGFYFIEMVSGAKHMTTRCIIQHNIR